MQGILSYPFFDPVLTDRAFLASPKAMLISFILAGFISGTFIFLFAFTGIFGNMVATLQPSTYAALLGQLLLCNLPCCCRCCAIVTAVGQMCMASGSKAAQLIAHCSPSILNSSTALLCPALPCPALPCPALPCPASPRPAPPPPRPKDPPCLPCSRLLTHHALPCAASQPFQLCQAAVSDGP